MGEGIRIEVDERNEKLGYKMRESTIRKIPFSVIIGNKEVEDNTISYRVYGKEETVTVQKEEFVKYIKEVINHKKLNRDL